MFPEGMAAWPIVGGIGGTMWRVVDEFRPDTKVRHLIIRFGKDRLKYTSYSLVNLINFFIQF